MVKKDISREIAPHKEEVVEEEDPPDPNPEVTGEVAEVEEETEATATIPQKEEEEVAEEAPEKEERRATALATTRAAEEEVTAQNKAMVAKVDNSPSNHETEKRNKK